MNRLLVVSVMVSICWSTGSLRAGEGSQKSKIEGRFDVVSWGKKQSLRDNITRIGKAISSKGADVSVYLKRFNDLKLHWNDAKKKFAAAGVDIEKDTIYFGSIDWVKKKYGLPVDHYIRFYVAANKTEKKVDLNLANAYDSSYSYFFRDHKYQRFIPALDRIDKTGSINQNGWKGVWTLNIDAAVFHPKTGDVHFFAKNKYRRFKLPNGPRPKNPDIAWDRVDKTGKINVNGWKGVWTTGIDAAVVHPKNRNVYFFKGNKYRRFNVQKDKVDKEGTIGVDGWKGVWKSDIDAAVLHSNGNIYFFKGNKYRRFNVEKDKVDHANDRKVGVHGWKGGLLTPIRAAVFRGLKD